MSKTGKTIAGVCVALAAIIGFGIYWLANNLDGIVAGAIEKVGSEVTGVPVRVSAVSISRRVRGKSVASRSAIRMDSAAIMPSG